MIVVVFGFFGALAGAVLAIAILCAHVLFGTPALTQEQSVALTVLFAIGAQFLWIGVMIHDLTRKA